MILRSFVTAFRTLTIIALPGRDTERFHQSLLFFPLVGAVLGFLHLLICQILGFISIGSIPLSGIFLCGANYILTGALHLDGFADTADAFGTVRDREKTLQILKDPHLGTYGVTAIVFLILWRVVIYQSLIESRNIIWIIPCLAFSRAIQGILLCILPYARNNTGKAFVFSGKPWYSVFLLIEIILIGVVFSFYYGFSAAFLPIIAGLAFIIPVVGVYLHRIKGITGDGIGASSELFELGFLTATVLLF